MAECRPRSGNSRRGWRALVSCVRRRRVLIVNGFMRRGSSWSLAERKAMMQKGIRRISSKRPLPRSQSLPTPEDYQTVLLWSEEDSCYVATLPAWQNAQTHGKTPGAAIKNAQEVLRLLIESAVKNREPIPPPERRHSGNLRLRLPVSLHGRLALEAEREGVSLNQWIVSKLAR